ncbi:hypothetical protein BKA93DRAFT_927067 [Sparassis latifolia]
MQCNWSTAANIIPRLGSIIRHSSFTTTSLHKSRTPLGSFFEQPKPRSDCWNRCRINASALLFTFAPSRASAALAIRQDIPSPPANTISASESAIASTSLTAAQLSRAAAQAARLCVRDGKVGDALYLIHSLHHSLYHGLWKSDSHRSKSNTHRSKASQPPLQPIDFGQPVSLRLTAHSFLHGMIRAGYHKKAAKYAEIMMANGLRIRSTTMESIVASLTTADSVLNGVTSKLSRNRLRLPDGPEVLQLRANMIGDRCTRVAFDLLSEARAFGQHRTKRMYDRLISTLLMQGEIIVGSLLFVLLVKDWELQQAKADALQASNGGMKNSAVEACHRRVLRLSPKDAPLSTPYPALEMMRVILKQIDNTLSRDPQGPEDQSYLRAPLQALANLAILLDTGQFRVGNLSPLIRSLYSCPKTDESVWIVRDGKPTRVLAHTYFRDVLSRLLESLKGNAPQRSVRLDLRSYNTLLSYSLRYRLSPALASQVLEHMCVKREPPFIPDVVTYNILLRSGTLLRRIDISDAALRVLRNSTMKSLQEPTVKPLAKGPSGPALQRLQMEPLNMTLKDGTELNFGLTADAYTLSSYVTHLTSIGMNRVIAKLLFDILPELQIVDHPSWGNLTRQDRRLLKHNSRQACLRRAVEYGPYVFAAILNALRKAGQTGLAERVWFLAKQAEHASWVPEFAPEIRPWCLPVHAYTSMMQCYAAECRKGFHTRRRTYRTLQHGEESELWKPRTTHRLTGWAHFVLKRQRLRLAANKRRQFHLPARRLQSELYKCMMSGGWMIYNALFSFNNVKCPSNVQAPSADARFFNAALELFGRQPHMYARARRSTGSHWKSRLGAARTRYLRYGRLSPRWTPMLDTLAKAMVAAGFSVPLGFREVFIGRWSPGTLSLGRQVHPLDRRPDTFPPVRAAFRPHALPVVRTRGLPLRRRGRTRKRNANVEVI